MKKPLALSVLIGAGLLLVSFTDIDNYSVSVEHYTVRPGQTLWEIAEIYMPEQNKIRDVRELIWEIKQKNKLTSCIIQPGQVLEIPLWKSKRPAVSDRPFAKTYE